MRQDQLLHRLLKLAALTSRIVKNTSAHTIQQRRLIRVMMAHVIGVHRLASIEPPPAAMRFQ
jgi:hypothetical protein